MLNRTVYEALPYAYIVLASLLLVTQDAAPAWMIGIALYYWGARVWLMRSNARCARATTRKRVSLPSAWYEAAPFVYLLAGLVCGQIYSHVEVAQLQPMTLAASAMFLFAGLSSWMMRIIRRDFHRLTPRLVAC
ncbi:hypothetical protein [Motiliproteus sediminis]|uniref:hypothetical protein n=1 Tax=Motiliproteus sediminis TaxID=1468178 RepID=UPI001AF023E3|nr:hypothetical protein [Motiliproteus sediminis]